jgi:type VI secretion system protein ImpK
MSILDSQVIRPKGTAPASQAPAPKLDRLALLYEGILTAIVRVQTGRQQVQDAEGFRARMKQALREIASTAARRGYSAEDVDDGNFAVVAFLDEAILTTPDNNVSQWAGKSLGQELFDQRSAGELFFKRLETLRANRDSQQLAEVLEVYYLCLLLGYEGKFAGGAKGELQLLMSNLRERIERIFGRNPEFSPDATLPDEPVVPAPVIDPLDNQVKWFAAAALIFAICCFVIFSFQLGSKSTDIVREVQERILSR